MTNNSYDSDANTGSLIGSDFPFLRKDTRKGNTPRKRLPGKEFDERRRVNHTQIRSLRFLDRVIDLDLVDPDRRDRGLRRRQAWHQRRLVRACFNLRRPYPKEMH